MRVTFESEYSATEFNGLRLGGATTHMSCGKMSPESDFMKIARSKYKSILYLHEVIHKEIMKDIIPLPTGIRRNR